MEGERHGLEGGRALDIGDRSVFVWGVDLHLRLEGRRKLARQVFEEVRRAILEGRLLPGERLPPTRELAQRLDVSRNTVALAYEWLVANGLASGRRGAGTFVAQVPALENSRSLRPAIALPCSARWRTIPRDFGRVDPGRFDFRPGVPDAHLFPFASWRRLLVGQVRSRKLLAMYGTPAGLPALREAIARHVEVSRGVAAGPDDVLVTHGTQHALDLIARVLLEPGTRVVIEEPGYLLARLLFEAAGAEVVPVEVDGEGLSVAALPDDARLVYVTPSHQYPLGMPMSPARRAELLAWARSRNAVIVEDDYDGEFRYGGRPLDSLQSMDRGGRVIYVGTFSKSMLPGLRLGFLVAPAGLREPLLTALFVTAVHCQLPAQGALAEFIREGRFAHHVQRMRREYAARHEIMTGALMRRFAGMLDPVASSAGMHVSAFLGGALAEARVGEEAAAAGVGFHQLSQYYLGRTGRPGLVLGYGGIQTDRIEEGLEVLRGCLVRASTPRTVA